MAQLAAGIEHTLRPVSTHIVFCVCIESSHKGMDHVSVLRLKRTLYTCTQTTSHRLVTATFR